MTFKEFGGRLYEVDSDGYYLKRDGNRLKRTKLKRGYEQYVTTDTSGKVHCKLLHRAIYENLIGEIPSGMTVDHINNDRKDNRIENLQLLTRGQNSSKDKRKIWLLSNNDEGIIVFDMNRFCRNKGWSMGTVSRAATQQHRKAYGYFVFRGI